MRCVAFSYFALILSLPVSLAADVIPGTNSKRIGSRSYLLHYSTKYDSATTHPLVLVLHGFGETADTMALDSGLSDKADEIGFLVAYPNGLDKRWNAGRCCGSAGDDVDFIKNVLTDIESTANVDSKRIYVVGMSNGSMMAYRLACELPDRFAAVAGVAGTRMTDKKPSRPVPALHIHGTSDRVIPYAGGRILGLGVQSTSVDDHIAFWVKNNGADDSPTTKVHSRSPLLVSEDRYVLPSNKRTEVVRITVEGGGHLWPGRPFPKRYEDDKEKRLLLGKTTQSVSANKLIWEFFARHQLP